MKLPSWRHEDRAAAAAAETEPVSAEIQAIRIDMGQLRELSAVLAARRWMRDIGIAWWLLVGLALLLVGVIAVLAITSVIGRRLRAFRTLVPPDRSVALATAKGVLTRDTVAHWETSGSRELILRLNKAPHGALVEV